MTPTTMSATDSQSQVSAPVLPISSEVAVLALGLIGMYFLTVYGLLQDGTAGLWSKGEHSHGPIMLGLSMWLLFNRWREYEAKPGAIAGQGLAWPAFIVGAILFAVGRALGIIYAEVGSFIPMLMGMVLLIGGLPLLNQVKFPVFFCIFMVPLPGFLLDPISHFIKEKVSIVVSELLWNWGYPISRNGVVLNIGPYQLLVADACAGMRTLFMLEAMGIFYLNVIRHSSLLRNVGLAILVVPISFTANTIRVIVLTLITYHFGDEAGQGFLHGFAGIVLFTTAMMLMMGLDSLFRAVARKTPVTPEQSA